jgi:chemotaxis signal transduction protein
MTDERAIQEVLQARANLLAQRDTHAAGGPSTAAARALVLRAGGEQYALALEDILQIGYTAGVTPLPGAPSTLAGIANFRGAVYSVMDLAQIFTGIARQEKGMLIFLRHDGMRLALWVDGVDSIVSYEEILPLEAASAHLSGMISPGLPLIDFPALLRHPAFTSGRKNPL